MPEVKFDAKIKMTRGEVQLDVHIGLDMAPRRNLKTPGHASYLIVKVLDLIQVALMGWAVYQLHETLALIRKEIATSSTWFPVRDRIKSDDYAVMAATPTVH